MADDNRAPSEQPPEAVESSDRRSSSGDGGSTPPAVFDCTPKRERRSEDDSVASAPKRRRRLDSSHDSSTATTPPDDFPPAVAFSTHDISRVPNHISTLDHVAKQIHSAAAEAWDRRFQYKNVFALLLHWQDDDLQVAPEVAALASTFRNVYHYATETWRIPTLKPDWDIKERLIRFLRANDAEGHLVIFYYAGHAMKNPQPGGAPLWSSRRTHGKTMFSGGILSNFEEAESDFLLLFDCCNAFHPPNRPKGSGRNIIEVISAVGFGSGAIAAEPGTDSFSHHLDEALALAKRRGPFKVVDLYMDILNRLFPEAPSRFSWEGSYVVDDHGPVEQKSRRQSPLHYWLCGGPKSINLAPLIREAKSKTGKMTDTSEQAFTESSSSASSSNLPEELSEAGIIQLQQAEFPQVLICFRVSNEVLSAPEWVSWLLEAPPEARDLIKIEGLYRSFSTLIILRMPVQVWCCLPQSNAASFIGFITTDNYGPEFQRDINVHLEDVRLQTEADQHLKRMKTETSTSSGPPAAPKAQPSSLAMMFSNTRLNTGGNDDWTDVQSVQALDEPKDNPRLLACPFHKHDPVYYASREHPDFGGKRHLYRACMGGFRSIQRLKEHLKRIHSPVQCERCYEVFPGTDRASCLARLAEHRKMDPCELGDPSFKRGIDESQWAALDKQNRKKNQELHRVEKWYEIWDVLFPGKERPATPWYSIPDPIISVPTGAEDDFSNLFVNIMDHKLLQGDVDLSTPQSVRDGVKRIAKVAIKTYINIRRPFPGSELESESHQTRPRASYAASSAAWTGSISGFSRPYATTAATSVFSGYEFQRPQFPAKPRPPTFDEDPE